MQGGRSQHGFTPGPPKSAHQITGSSDWLRRFFMESKVKILGHPVHPVLIVFPLGLLVTAVIFDILYLATGNTIFPTIALRHRRRDHRRAAGSHLRPDRLAGAAIRDPGEIGWAGSRHRQRHPGDPVRDQLAAALAGCRPHPRGTGLDFLVCGGRPRTGDRLAGRGDGVPSAGGRRPGANLDAPSSLSSTPASTPMMGGAVAGRAAGRGGRARCQG